MSFDAPTIKHGISPYRSVNFPTNFGEHSVEAIASWILDTLNTLYPNFKTASGDRPINYSYFFDLNPKNMNALSLPAVAVDVVLSEYGTLGSLIGAGDGGYAAGDLREVEIGIVVFATSARRVSAIEAMISRKLDRYINNTPGIPILYVNKTHMADDRGFSTMDRFVMTSLWQNIPDEVFVKLTFMRSAIVEDYIDDDLDNVWTGIVGGINQSITTGGVQISGNGPSHVSLSVKFTPTIP